MKTALVLSGGGAKGWYQYEAYSKLIEIVPWLHPEDLIGIWGISVGALNGVLFSQLRVSEARKIWDNISDKQVYRGRMDLWHIAKALLLKRDGVLSMRPLERMAKRVLAEAPLIVPLQVGMVDMETGKCHYATIQEGRETNVMALMASSCIPLAFPPVDGYWLDGGLRDSSPLGQAIKAGAERIVVINCNSRMVEPRQPKGLLQIGARSLEIMMNEIFLNDLETCHSINFFVEERAKNDEYTAGADPSNHFTFWALGHKNAPTYRHIPILEVTPDRPIGSMLDFNTREHRGRGVADAREAWKHYSNKYGTE